VVVIRPPRRGEREDVRVVVPALQLQTTGNALNGQGLVAESRRDDALVESRHGASLALQLRPVGWSAAADGLEALARLARRRGQADVAARAAALKRKADSAGRLECQGQRDRPPEGDP
jgi:hypothetical protein